jgi:riboflavin synthase
MFTGIVEEAGEVVAFAKRQAAWRLELAARTVTQGVAVGDSIAVNGCCLTAVEVGPERLAFDLLEETCRVTNLGEVRAGDAVNLERSLRYDGRVGGHFVTGHIDGQGRIETLERRGSDVFYRVRPNGDARRYLLRKGCVAIDGISLTIAEVEDDSFFVWLIPHTMEVTNLHRRKAGDAVNLEFDLLGKYVERMLSLQDLRPLAAEGQQ